MKNAVAINEENIAILKKAAADAGHELGAETVGICQLLPIGPQIIGPK